MQQPLLSDFYATPSPFTEEPAAVQTQREGRQRARADRSRLHGLMREAYGQRDWTDAELAMHLGIQRSTVNARRAEMIDVIETGTRKNPATGVSNTTWGRRDA